MKYVIVKTKDLSNLEYFVEMGWDKFPVFTKQIKEAKTYDDLVSISFILCDIARKLPFFTLWIEVI